VVRVLVWKLRMAVLWISLAACQSASVTLLLFEPGFLSDFVAGRTPGVHVDTVGGQVLTALFWLGPMAFAYLTLVLKDDANRQANALLAGGGALYGVSALIASPGESAGANIVGVVAVLIQLLIVWHAWKWPLADAPVSDHHREDAAPR
jgi:hypothetical protein